MLEVDEFLQFAIKPLVSYKLKYRNRLFALAAGSFVLHFGSLGSYLPAQTPTAVMVPTWRYDVTHAGQNPNETALTPANVNVNTFGKLFSVKVDSTVYAQPLFMPGLTMSDGLVHNVFFVATENDSIYAFDADSNTGANASPIWKVSLLDAAHGAGPGATAVPPNDSAGGLQQGDIYPTIGITGTPVIDPATNTMYVVGNTKESGVYYSRLHAINLFTGAEQSNPIVQTSPVAISATVPGTGLGSSGGLLSFNPLIQNQRPALDLYNGHVYIGYSSHGDNGPWHGWLFAYDATTMQQTAVVCLSPNDKGAAIWAAGAGMPIDEDASGGRMFVVTGNGKSSLNYPPFSGSTNLGESIIDFSLANGGLTPTDGFTTFNINTLNAHDMDQGSGGILLVPDQDGPNTHILIQAGKEGRILVLNRDNLGGFAAGATSNTNILQDIPKQIAGLWSTPAYWNGNVYVWGSGEGGSGDVPKMFTLSSGVLSTTPSSQSTIKSGFPGASFTVSSNGAQDGIAWAVRTDQYSTHGPAVLYAWDANNLGTLLYESDTNAPRDGAGRATKFSIPMVTNGKVYLPAYQQVDVYGLFNTEPITAAPLISPNGGTFYASQNVQLTSATSSASIYYTLDGSVPTPSSPLYTDGIPIGTNTNLRAIATAPGYIQSAVSSATFKFPTQTPPVSFSPAPGNYTKAQQVKLSNADANAVIYYTLDGSTPSASSTVYSAPIPVSTSTTIAAVAIDPSLQTGAPVSGVYSINQPTTSINFPNGFPSAAGLKLNGSTAITSKSQLQLTNGKLHQTASVFWNQPVGIQSFTSDFSFQQTAGTADGMTFTIQNKGLTALGGNSAGLGYSGIGKSVAIKFDLYSNAGEGTDSTGVYVNGAIPTVPAVSLTASGIILRSGDTMHAHLAYDGTTLSMTLTDLVTKKSFTLSKAINIASIVGSNKAYVGFTGSTGGLASSQQILSWIYTTP